MSIAIWPPIDPQELLRKETESLTRELDWLLESLKDTFASFKAGLEECAALLSPEKGPSTLVLSSQRSESLKGYVTRTGTRLVKGDINLRMPGLLPPRGANSNRLSISTAPTAPTFVLEELTSARTLINASLDVIDVTRWAGNSNDANFIVGQLRLLYDNILEAKQTLKGEVGQKPWWENSVDEKIFDSAFPRNLSFQMSIADAALVLEVRTLEAAGATAPAGSLSGFGFRERLALAIGSATAPSHDEVGQTYNYQGHEVRVREKLRVESIDPSLLAVMAKLSALEHSTAMSRRALDVVMGKDDG